MSRESTDRDRLIAMLVPLPEPRTTVAELIAISTLCLAERTWRPGARRLSGARPPSEHLEEMRDQRILNAAQGHGVAATHPG